MTKLKILTFFLFAIFIAALNLLSMNTVKNTIVSDNKTFMNDNNTFVDDHNKLKSPTEITFSISIIKIEQIGPHEVKSVISLVPGKDWNFYSLDIRDDYGDKKSINLNNNVISFGTKTLIFKNIPYERNHFYFWLNCKNTKTKSVQGIFTSQIIFIKHMH